MSELITEFALVRPETVEEAVAISGERPDGRFLAGGTDLIVNMRRGLVQSDTLIDLSRIPPLRRFENGSDGLVMGAAVTLCDLSENVEIRKNYSAISEACDAIAGPGHRSAATIGGNLCLDTRCLYYNQSHWWRKANGFCLKFKGETCHVAPAGNRCRAAFSGDLAPALIAHRAEITIAGPEGTRRIDLADLYREDGTDYLTLGRGELIVSVHVPPPNEMERLASAYAKVRVRGAIDFPLAGIAMVGRMAADGCLHLTAALTGTNSCPFLLTGIDPVQPDDDREKAYARLEKLVQQQVSPQRTTTTASHYRRLAVSALARRLAARVAATVDQTQVED